MADALMKKATNVDEINIFIFRDSIGYFDLANLMNGNPEMNGKGLVKVFPIKMFFDIFFDDNEYNVFLKYANDFHEKCNRAISYKTVIMPSPATLKVFRYKKMEMLRDTDYKKIADLGKSGSLPDYEFKQVSSSFQSNKMYLAMVSTEDFAESFISAEYSYDVYQNAMGELELTGIIAGYLKSIEQLLFSIAKFHQDEGLTIKSRDGYVEFTSDNENLIDSTLGSLNAFVTSPKAKMALDAKIRGCISVAIQTWTKYQRNGYFHKHNLYKKDNKIKEVRELTIYLYFLILGGICFTPEQRVRLGVVDNSDGENKSFNISREYPRFKEWFDNAMSYDMPASIAGLWLLLERDEKNITWNLHAYLMKHFYMEDFTDSRAFVLRDMICTSHVKDIPVYTWVSDNKKRIVAVDQVSVMFSRYFHENDSASQKVQAIVTGFDKDVQLIYYRD